MEEKETEGKEGEPSVRVWNVKKLIAEGWRLHKVRGASGKVYGRLRKGRKEVMVGPWGPELEELLKEGAKEGVKRMPSVEIPTLCGIIGNILLWFSVLFVTFPAIKEVSPLEVFIPRVGLFIAMVWIGTYLARRVENKKWCGVAGAALMVAGFTLLYYGWSNLATPSRSDLRFVAQFVYPLTIASSGLSLLKRAF